MQLICKNGDVCVVGAGRMKVELGHRGWYDGGRCHHEKQARSIMNPVGPEASKPFFLHFNCYHIFMLVIVTYLYLKEYFFKLKSITSIEGTLSLLFYSSSLRLRVS